MPAKRYESGGKKALTRDQERAKIQKYALRHAKNAIDVLAAQMQTAPEKAVRVSAAREILDRGIGRPTTTIGGDPSAPIVIRLEGSDKDL